MDLSDPIYNDEDAARDHLESLRWADGRFCPHCGATEGTVKVEGKKRSHRPGLYYCNACKGQFTVRVGTIFERSKVPLHKWVLAYHLMCASKKGVSAHQLHRMLGVHYRTAWFMAHRIRETMREDGTEPMGGPGSPVEADETYYGKLAEPPTETTKGRPFVHDGARANRRAIVCLVSGGKSRTFHVKRADAATVREILVTNALRSSELHTDESNLYTQVGNEFRRHLTVRHSAEEYFGKHGQTTNRVENFFSVFKRGMRGVYQHCAEKHLQRYCDEFDFRYSNRDLDDFERAAKAIRQAEGRRLTYQQPRR